MVYLTRGGGLLREENKGVDRYIKSGGAFQPISTTGNALPPDTYVCRLNHNYDIVFVPHPVQTDNLVNLPDTMASEVIGDIAQFWKNEAKYAAIGSLHRRGYLLHGPPGSGKSSVIATVVKNLVDANGIVVYLDAVTEPKKVVSLLKQFRVVEPSRECMMVIEDIDSLIAVHGEADILSTLDGDGSIDKMVVVATTNFPEKLEKRVVDRPGRFDRVVYVGMPSEADRKAFLASKLGATIYDLDRWAFLTSGFSIAHLKETLVGVCCWDEDMEKAVKRVRDMGNVPHSEGDRKVVGFAAAKSDPDTSAKVSEPRDPRWDWIGEK